MVRNIGIVVQAHMGSSRLPNKMMLDLCGSSVLSHVIRRLQKVTECNELIIATSDLAIDDIIEKECAKYAVECYRGSNDDVLSRFYYAAKAYHLTDIARVCADNTLIDWSIINKQIREYTKGHHKIVTYDSNVPLGLGCELFSFDMLEDAFFNGNEHYHREHVTPYIYEKYGSPYKVKPFEDDYGKYRFTLDTAEDWSLIQHIYKALYNGNDDITLIQVIGLMKKHPELYNINKDVHQKTVKE